MVKNLHVLTLDLPLIQQSTKVLKKTKNHFTPNHTPLFKNNERHSILPVDLQNMEHRVS